MGLEIPEEFWPITPLRTISLTRTKASPITPTKDNDNGSKVSDLNSSINEEEDCHTPKSKDQLLKTPLVCPPAPRKPRPVKRKSTSTVATQLFFHVPRDLNSVFVPLVNSSKKIKVG
ncbi:hypothetical protein IFM89_029090 [Coptis chinensis]|uniref:Uncharacterized protein n=1 Tax=Coptis chinensis TaxID=261450 RepID=A0A835M777_9MAGN|nr:hypothetical protein IFM89_029090 [Coptis chinensis]